MKAKDIVTGLLDGHARVSARRLLEATVRLPPRSRRWVAVYTGVHPGKQVWRSTGLSDRDAALTMALEWEAEARQQRAALGLGPRRPTIRVRRRPAGPEGPPTAGVEPLSQREVSIILKISERAVRDIERRALAKLRTHPMLRQLWVEYATGGQWDDPHLEEQQKTELTPAEITALAGLTHTEEEVSVLDKLLAWISGHKP